MGAEVFAFDYSTAVDACWLNHAAHPRLHVWQGDIYKIPLKLHQFDFVLCFGVLQHTPDVHGSFLSLLTVVKPGGQLVIDVYPKSWRCYLWIKYWLRPLTKCIPPEKLFSSVEKWVPILLPVSRALARVPRVGRQLRHLLPIANYEGMYPLTEQQLKECAVLDTYDMLAPQFDSPQTESTLLAWFKQAGLENVNVFKRGQVIGRGTRHQNGLNL